MTIPDAEARLGEVVDRISRTGEPVTVTKEGVPVARIVPVPPPEPPKKAGVGLL